MIFFKAKTRGLASVSWVTFSSKIGYAQLNKKLAWMALSAIAFYTIQSCRCVILRCSKGNLERKSSSYHRASLSPCHLDTEHNDLHWPPLISFFVVT